MNLAKFALLYKSSMLALRNINGKEQPVHSFVSGLFGGYWVFGQSSSSVNQQIVIYVFARVMLALAKLAIQPPGDNALVGSHYGGHGGAGFLKLSEDQVKTIQKYAWPAFASMSWAGVMWLFEGYPETLQPSLRSSMTYMYVEFSFGPTEQKEQRETGCCAPFHPVHILLTQELTSNFPFSLDTPTRKNGTRRGISSGTTNSVLCEKLVSSSSSLPCIAWRLLSLDDVHEPFGGTNVHAVHIACICIYGRWDISRQEKRQRQEDTADLTDLTASKIRIIGRV